jgi:uncharacterized protein YbaP (TraB family)
MIWPGHRLPQGVMGAFSAFLLLVVLVLPVQAKEQRLHGQGRLFKVTAAGISPSYVFGTMHSTDPEILVLPPPVARAFDSSLRLVLEMVFTPEIEAHMNEGMLLRDGRTLAGIVGPTIYGDLLKRAAAYGLPAQQMNQFQPWAASLIFSVPVAEIDRGAAGVLELDRSLQRAADARGVPVYGLESLKEQIELFSSGSERDQIDGLRLTLDLNPEIDTTFAEMKEAYLAGDLDRLHAMAMSMFSEKDARLAEQFEKQFIEIRNKRMASRMARHIKQGSAFVAVGALHLSGDKGILRLLETRGYIVTKVY